MINPLEASGATISFQTFWSSRLSVRTLEDHWFSIRLFPLRQELTPHCLSSCRCIYMYVIQRAVLFCFWFLHFDRAADWKLDQPDWTGRVRVCAKGKECYIKIEDKNTGEYYNTLGIQLALFNNTWTSFYKCMRADAFLSGEYWVKKEAIRWYKGFCLFLFLFLIFIYLLSCYY